ncbi:MAG: hypothetical protein K2M69_08560 [Muribaculaceae bacterium]|nr:hypothetical protein [Muribaculaceae bacterium]
MIISAKTTIIIVHDFGVSADDKAMVALREAIENRGDYVVKIVDLPAVVREEHTGEELTESKVIELAARKLEQLSTCSGLKWDGSDYELGAPTAIIVFGKSAMLAGGLGQKNILFINPEYDSEWPWKKLYYADQKLAGQYHRDKHEYERQFMETVLWEGTECTRPWCYSRRYGLIANKDYIGEFWNRYPCMAEVNRDLDGNTEGLARFICEFADDELTFPLEEVYEAIKNLPGSDIPSLNKICDFIEPVKFSNITVPGIRFGTPMANGQSCFKLKVAGLDYTLPLESIHVRNDLNALRDAIILAGESLKKVEPEHKRILIVPDYFTPYNSPNVKELYDGLKHRGYYVAVYVAGNTLEKSRQGLERRCKVKPFDLIVTLETGCLLATRGNNCTRIFVNPDWSAWEWMKLRLGEDKKPMQCRGIDNSGPFFSYYLNPEEIGMARQMAERANIRRGDKPIYGWFTVDAVESHLPEEHLKRFNTCAYIPDLRLDTEEGIDILATQINNILTVDDNE